MDASVNSPPAHPPASAQANRGFLVVHRGGRWTDVLRLSPDRPAVIGRASSNSIVIRSHQASRRHAEVRWDGGFWWLRDLGSRNGTRLDGVEIEQVARRLQDGDRIEVAGCSLTFVTSIAEAFNASEAAVPAAGNAAATDDQLTLRDLQAPEITDRLHESHYLDPLDFSPDSVAEPPARRDGSAQSPEHAPSPDQAPSPEQAPSPDQAPSPEHAPSPDHAWATLFRLAYRVASCRSVESAAELTLESIAAAVPNCFAGVYLASKADAAPELVTFVAPGNRSYGGPTPAMIDALSAGPAILIRNLSDDSELQAADSRGELSTQSALLAPIHLTAAGKAAAPKTVGFLHLYTDDVTRELTREHLELAVAAAGVLGAAVENLSRHGKLVQSLNRSRRAVDSLRRRLDESVRIIGNSPPIRRLKEIIARVASTDTTVLVRGESGVGKELVAGAIHQASPRRDGPLICLNCAALSPSLLESELFGHEKGAFTGATEQKKGKFEAADGGTLMLDEIGEMDINLQAKLLRVLEGHRFERVGGHVPLKVDVRLIAATNRDLAAEVAAGRFREDLFYRLNVLEIVVPPLRERGDDVLLLADHFVSHFADKTARTLDGLTPAACRALAAHPWPGNVRELKNVIERAVVLSSGSMIDVEDLALPPAAAAGEQTDREASDARDDESGGGPQPAAGRRESRRPASLAELEKQHLIEVLRSTGGNKSRAAGILGIERSTLDRKLKRYEVRPGDYGA